MTLSIVVPSIAGRETDLASTLLTYERLTPSSIEWIIEYHHANCGAAWNAGVAKATGDFVLIAADDLEPETAAWLPAALRTVEKCRVPLGLVREDVIGTFGRDFCRVPFCRREWWRDVPEIHYYSDNAWSDLMIMLGHVPTVAEGFDFYHRRSTVGRDESPERVDRDRLGYEYWARR